MIELDVWLYGPLSQYGGEKSQGSHAHLIVELPAGSRMRDLMDRLGIPLDRKGITFVNSQLSDMPGLGADLDSELMQGDRIGIFHSKSMWPFQYRFGAATSPALRDAMLAREEGAIHHSPASTQAAGERGGDEKTDAAV